MKSQYDHSKIEKKWQKEWAKQGIYNTKIKFGSARKGKAKQKPKAYILDMFPYPSGAGLHVGHPRGYIATDIYSRFKKMNGYDVLHPMGWDAFGLPAEEFAIKNKIHPSIAVKKNVARYKEQLSILGFNYDWSREVNTTDPEYYKWTQWAFLQMHKKGLTYESYEPINWCPSCKTGLANEDLEDGKCERCGSMVEKKPIRQWVIRITDYADRLLKDLDTPKLKWPESIKESQRNWIGRSEGAELTFSTKTTTGEVLGSVTVFTTRADTLYGVTYIVLAPESHIVDTWKQKKVISNSTEVDTYIKEVKTRTAIERTAEGKEKTGVELKGIVAVHPITGAELPVWVADYVLADYGTGSVMAVPAHDERDFMFAKRYMLPIVQVVAPYIELTGIDAPQDDVETLERNCVDLIIENNKGEFLLITENANNITHTHFVGGGLDKDESYEDCAKREFVEETGYTDFEIVRKLPIAVYSNGYRQTKNKNQSCFGFVFHVKLLSDKKIKSEVEDGKHSINWVAKELVAENITWPHHQYMWKEFLNETAYTGPGRLLNSAEFDGQNASDALTDIVKKAKGKMVVKYKLRDWVFSRQRYWGEPIPLVHCAKCGVVPLPEKELPLKLPNVKSYEPTGTGESPLAAISSWVNTKCPKCKGSAKRETNTMPQWAGSCWYYLRYIDPKNKSKLIDPKKEKAWQPVDMYVGGAEHATRHLIYARFWHKFLYDIGTVSTKEPFMQLKNQGLIAAEDGRKMSKRYGNVVNPDDIVKLYGADTLRVYEMFMGPFDQGISWSTDNMIGSRRFLERVWRLHDKVSTETEKYTDPKSILVTLHKTIKKVTEDIDTFSLNTAVSSLMILLNTLEKQERVSHETYKTLITLIAPFAPHMADEIWSNIISTSKKDRFQSVYLASWPTYNKKYLIDDEVNVVVQINGKVRANIILDSGEAKQESAVLKHALQLSEIQSRIGDKSPDRIIFIPGKIINLVFKSM